MYLEPTQIEYFKPKQSGYQWKIHHFDRIDYRDALDLQYTYNQRVQEGDDHYLMLLEHNPVITLGRRTETKHLLWTEDEIKKQGIDLFRVNRGGSATYHGPGQLVGYVICKSSRVGGIHELVSKLLQMLSRTINEFGISNKIDHENPGIWTDTDPPRKLAAIGMSNKKGYTLHGFAVNIDMLLTGFTAIVPCGLTLPISTLAIEGNLDITVDQFKNKFLPIFREIIND
jgi:lipoate-protein ligase B